MLFGKMREILGRASEDFIVEALTFGREEVGAATLRSIDKAGKWNQRDCPLKPTLVVWLTIMLTPFRNLSIPNVFRQLLSIIRTTEPELRLSAVTPEALHHARRRLGSEPLKLLFEELSQPANWTKASFHGHRVIGGDGCFLRMPDTEANENKFGRKVGGRGASGYPQLLAVSLVDASSHKVVDVEFLRCNGSERAGMAELIQRSLGTGDLLLMDRGLSSYRLFALCQSLDVRWLVRIPSMWKPKIVKKLQSGDCLVRIRPCRVERKKMRALGQKDNVALEARMISYKVRDGETVRLLTDLVDSNQYDGRELAVLYHQRWEAELAYDELKTHFAAVANGKQPTHFRSKKPDGVLQEAYGMLVAYNLVRELMARAASERGIEPTALSFVDTLEVIKIWCPVFERSSPKEQKLAKKRFLQDIADCQLRPRRPRRCPRKIKVKMSSYHLKRPSDQEEKLDFKAELKLVEQ